MGAILLKEYRVSASVRTCADTVESYILNSALSAQLIDRHEISAGGYHVITLVFEKYFIRNSSRASLTITIDNLSSSTRVHAVGSGAGTNTLFRFDWGASSNIEAMVGEALKDL